MYWPRLLTPAGVRPGSVSTNFRMPPVSGRPTIASARAPGPQAGAGCVTAVGPHRVGSSAMLTTGAMYPAPPSTIMKPVIAPAPSLVAVTVAGVKAPGSGGGGRYASAIVTSGFTYS